jgi:hypothetical protein
MHPLRGGVPAEAEQVVPLVQAQVQPAGDRGEHLLGGVRATLLLDPAVIVGRHVAQRGDLLAAQATGAPARATGQSDILGLERLPPGAQEVGKLGAVHPPILPTPAEPRKELVIPGPPVPGQAEAPASGGAGAIGWGDVRWGRWSQFHRCIS